MELLGTVKDAAIGWVVQGILGSLFTEKMEAWSREVDLDGDVEKLKTAMLFVNTVVDAARGRKLQNEGLCRSLLNLKRLLYDAEDVMDELDYYRLQREIEGGNGDGSAAGTHPMGDRASSSTWCSAAPNFFAKKIVDLALPNHRKRKREDDNLLAPERKHDVSQRINKIANQLRTAGGDVHRVLQLEISPTNAMPYQSLGEPRNTRLTTSMQVEPKVYGRDAERNKVVELLINEKYSDLRVLPIVGGGGVGKTTLARFVCDDQRIRSHFDLQMWVCVSTVFDEVRLTREILEHACKEDGQDYGKISCFDVLQDILLKNIRNKRFLLVLDDIWEDKDKIGWVNLLAPLKRNQVPGCMILATTRSKSVAKMIGTMDVVEMKGLDEEDFWLLFEACAFGNENCTDHPTLHTIGQQIAKTLKGYPLAAQSVGALLKENLSSQHWQDVQETWKSRQENDGDILPILELSYDYLPSHLQHCFSYCSLFPEDHRFNGETLVYVWISQNFVQSKDTSKRLEETGMQYLYRLVDLGFFQKVDSHYVMHDLMHELAEKVSSNDCATINGSKSKTIQPSVRHLSIITTVYDKDEHCNFPSEKFENILRTIGSLKKLRTLMFFGLSSVNLLRARSFQSLCKEIESLRLLRIHVTGADIDSVHNFIKPYHLRCLEFMYAPSNNVFPSGNQKDIAFPQALTRFYHLQVLDFDIRGNPTVPTRMNNLVNLRHLFVNEKVHSTIPSIGNMTSLQELRVFRVQNACGFEIKQLQSMNKLVKLGISQLGNVKTKEEASQAKLIDKEHLEMLWLSWDDSGMSPEPTTEGTRDVHVLEGLRPNQNLKYLHITGYSGATSPTWLDSNVSVTSLKTLHLKKCKGWQILPSLEMLPLLRELTLISMWNLKGALSPEPTHDISPSPAAAACSSCGGGGLLQGQRRRAPPGAAGSSPGAAGSSRGGGGGLLSRGGGGGLLWWSSPGAATATFSAAGSSPGAVAAAFSRGLLQGLRRRSPGGRRQAPFSRGCALLPRAMDPSKIPAGIDPERAFSLDVRVSAYTAKLDDGSETNIHRQDLEWVVDTVGYRFESFIQDLGERIKWGSSQEPAIWCFDRNCGEQFRMLTTLELHNALNERWNLKWLCVFVEIVEKSGYQCSQSNANQLNIVDLDEANPSNAADRVVDWSSIEIQVGPNVGEDDRDVAVTEEQMYAILGLRDDDARAEERRRAPPISAPNATNAAADDNVGAAIPVDDSFAGVTNIGYDRQDPHMKFGITYPSMAEFKMATKQYAIKHEFDMGTEKSDTTRFRGFCRGEGCEWRIVGILMPDNKTVRVSKMIDKHTCASTSRVKTSMASQAWIAERSLGILRKTPNMGAKELQERLQDQYNITLTYPTVWKGRQRAIEQLYCPWEESFHMLYNFKAEVEFRSPGSFVEIGTKTVNGDIYFHRFFLAFKPCIDGFVNGCRPYLSIDSTALNGKWNGHLAAVTALDGHNWMFPVAFGFLESESADNWTWFMQQLKKAIGHQSILAVSTDACKGLENAVNKVFPGTEQRECFRHLMLNFVKKFHGDVFGNMWPAASAYTPEKFEYHMNKILTSCPNVADYLNRHHNLLWMRSKFSTEIKCEYINNNLAESFNSWIKDIKDLPVVDLADKLHEMIMELFDKRRRIGERLDGYILPAIVHQLNARTRGLANLTVKRSANHSAQVIETDENHKTIRHVVQLLNHECTCREWQLTGKPCSHALAFITTERNASMESFVHEYYTLSKFRAAYEGVIEPMTDKSQWPQVDPGFKMLPPLKKRSSGRPRKLRFKNCFEKGGDVAKKQHRCKQCGELGHRQAGCPLNGPKKRMRKSQKKAQSKEIHTPKKMRTSLDATTTDSPGPMTRRQLALSIGEGASQSAVTTSRMTTRSPAKATANKKLTPKRKRN